MRSCFAGASAKITPAQRRYEPFLHALARAFPGVFCCLVATRQGEVLARLPLETQHPKNPDFDETEFDDIPVALRKLDDEMTAGDMEFQAPRPRGSRRCSIEAQTLRRPPRSSSWASPSATGSRGGTWPRRSAASRGGPRRPGRRARPSSRRSATAAAAGSTASTRATCSRSTRRPRPTRWTRRPRTTAWRPSSRAACASPTACGPPDLGARPDDTVEAVTSARVQ